MTKKKPHIILYFWIFSFLIYTLLLIQVRRYRDGSDWFFFTHLTRQVISGNWTVIYRELEYGQYHFYYSPLSLFLLAPIVWASDLLRLAPIHQQIVNIVPFAMFDLLMAWSAVRLVRVFQKLTVWEEVSIAAFSLFSYFTLMSSLYYGRFESAMLFFLFEGIRAILSKQFHRGSMLLALAILVKQTALFALIPLIVWVFLRYRKHFYEFIGILLIATIFIFSPFLLNDASSVLVAFSTQFQNEIRGFSIWHLGRQFPLLASSNARFVPMLIAVYQGCVAGSVWIIRRKLTAKILLTFMTFSIIGTLFLMPTVLSYYLLFPLMMLFIWEKSVTGHLVVTYVYLGVALIVHSLGFSRETTVYEPSVLTSWVILLTYTMVFVFLYRHIADVLE